MSLLDDVRRLADGLLYNPANQYARCRACNHIPIDDNEHAPDCPALSMPKIVAALESIARVAASIPYECGYADCKPGDDDACPSHRLEWTLES